MNATGLPLPVVSAPATPPAVEPAATPLLSGAEAPTDFVLALAQMLGASVPTKLEPSGGSVAGDEAAAADAQAAALALLPLPIAQPQQQWTPPPQGADNVDPLEMLGLSDGGERAAARDAAILQALTERLAGTNTDTTSQDAQLPSGALSSLDSTQQRTPTTEVAAQARSSLQQPVGTRAWADELGSRLTMMTEKGHHTASLRLSPEHLGPLEVRIAMRDDQASVWFGAAHADTRAAIEQALPRLRELFAAQGMSLADAGVFREPPKQQFTDWPTGDQRGSGSDAVSPTEGTSVPSRVQLGLLDAYA